ncbi:nucleoside deaminase [Vibrio sp. H11]|uniref:nucleoside deaminase n=1 Tax=Vibrio sp. H11 TaxID=2565928 RepID=UPI0010A5AE1E|nr:nucleoside deaminase [Vibrio sp. H11]
MCQTVPTHLGQYFQLACDTTIEGLRKGTGGPFGATLVRNGEVICAVGNTVLEQTDISGHAEMVAVRQGCKKLDTLDLSDCVMYATCEPCPMCVAVMMWAGIKTCYYASSHRDAAAHGFSDQHLRDYLDGSDKSAFDMIHVTQGREDCQAIWDEFTRLSAKP